MLLYRKSAQTRAVHWHVLADAGYGSGAPFRQGLSARGLSWAVGVPRTLKVFTTDVGLLFPQANRGKPRLHPVPSEIAQDAAHVLTTCPWRRVTWRQGTKGPLAARFLAVRVRLADGPRSPRHGHLPGEDGRGRRSGDRGVSRYQRYRVHLRPISVTNARRTSSRPAGQFRMPGMSMKDYRSWISTSGH